MVENEKQADVAALTVELLSAYLSNNTVPAADLAGLIQSTKAALTQEVAVAEPELEKPAYAPAVSTRKSLASPDHILSLIDGKPYKTLKRHLAANGLTPDTYRERYGLPANYPMVAPAFAAVRRAIAEKIGLGNRKMAGAASAEKPVAAEGAPAAERKANAKASAPKAPAGKAKSLPAPAASEAPAAPAAEKTRKQPTKRMARMPKSPTPAGSEGTFTAASTDSAPVAKASKGRGKLGLFGKDAAAAEAPADAPAPKAAPVKPRWKRPGTAGN